MSPDPPAGHGPRRPGTEVNDIVLRSLLGPDTPTAPPRAPGPPRRIVPHGEGDTRGLVAVLVLLAAGLVGSAVLVSHDVPLFGAPALAAILLGGAFTLRGRRRPPRL